MRYVGLENIEPQTMRLVGYGNAHDVRSSSMRFSNGDVLYGKMRPYLNKVWVAEFDGLCSVSQDSRVVWSSAGARNRPRLSNCRNNSRQTQASVAA